MVHPENGGVKRRHPLPEIKRDTRPIAARVNEIVDTVTEMLRLVNDAPKETPGGLLLRRPLQHMVAIAAIVMRMHTDADTRGLLDRVVAGLIATVDLVSTIKDIASRDEHLRILERFAVNSVRQNKHRYTHPHHAETFSSKVRDARFGTNALEKLRSDARGLSQQPLLPSVAVTLCADISTFIADETASATDGADKDDSAATKTPTLSAAKEALRSQLETCFREIVSSDAPLVDGETDGEVGAARVERMDGGDSAQNDNEEGADGRNAADTPDSADSVGPMHPATATAATTAATTSSNAGWSGATLKAYGSSVSGLGFTTSDMDLCIAIDPEVTKVNRMHDETGDGANVTQISFTAAVIKVLSARIDACDFCEVEKTVLTARIPIVQLKQASTGVECDICVNQELPMYNTLLLHTYTQVDPRVRQLVLAVKHWAKQRGINDASNGTLSSYAWVIMVLHFLQRRRDPVIPNLQHAALVSAAREAGCLTEAEVNGFEIAFCNDGAFAAVFLLKHQRRGPNTETIGELFKEFFHYFAFEFNSIDFCVGVRTGCVMRGTSTYGNYAKQNVDQRMPRPRPWRLSIEDPIEVAHDLGNVIFSPEAMAAIVAEFVRACNVLHAQPQPASPGTSADASIALKPSIRTAGAGGVADGEITITDPALDGDVDRSNMVDAEEQDENDDTDCRASTAFALVCEAVPSVTKRVISCFNCGGEGHISSACPRRGRGPSAAAAVPARPADGTEGSEGGGDAAGAAAAEREVVYSDFAPLCYICGNPEHSFRDCPFKKACFVCGKPGHQKRDCPQFRHQRGGGHGGRGQHRHNHRGGGGSGGGGGNRQRTPQGRQQTPQPRPQHDRRQNMPQPPHDIHIQLQQQHDMRGQQTRRQPHMQQRHQQGHMMQQQQQQQQHRMQPQQQQRQQHPVRLAEMVAEYNAESKQRYPYQNQHGYAQMQQQQPLLLLPQQQQQAYQRRYPPQQQQVSQESREHRAKPRSRGGGTSTSAGSSGGGGSSSSTDRGGKWNRGRGRGRGGSE